ncbi:hypothetical protein GCM10027202_34250 [Microvirgula curvata]
MTLAHSLASRYIAPVPFNSGTGLGGPNTKADGRPAAIFTSVHNTIAAPSMPSRGGGVLARAGSFVPVRQPCHALGTLAWRRGVELHAHKGGHHA